MKLWLISQNENTGWDTYDSAVVAAETEKEARAIHPAPVFKDWEPNGYWASTPENVTAKLIGEAIPGTDKGVIFYSRLMG